jgi:hypothetical protein
MGSVTLSRDLDSTVTTREAAADLLLDWHPLALRAVENDEAGA